jgi:hypothetical protein
MSSTARSLEREKAMDMVKKAGISTRRIIRILTSTEVRVRDRDRDKDSTVAATVKGGIIAGVETEADVDYLSRRQLVLVVRSIRTRENDMRYLVSLVSEE